MKWLKLLKKHWKLLFVVLYVLSPIDLLPDFLAPVGIVDDLLIIVAALATYLRERQQDIETREREQLEPEEDILEGELIE